MVGDDFTHQNGNFVRGVEFASFFTCIGCEIAYQIFIDKTENVVALFVIHRNNVDKVNQFSDSLCLSIGIFTEF